MIMYQQYHNTPTYDDNSEYHQYQQYHQQYHQQYQPPSQLHPPIVDDVKNVTQTTLTLQQFGGIVVVLGSIALSGFSTWNNLNRELDIQKNGFEQFKVQITKDMDNAQESIKDLKRLQDTVKGENVVLTDNINKRIMELDATVSQLYQKVTAAH
jgi:hypothetical protein